MENNILRYTIIILAFFTCTSYVTFQKQSHSILGKWEAISKENCNYKYLNFHDKNILDAFGKGDTVYFFKYRILTDRIVLEADDNSKFNNGYTFISKDTLQFKTFANCDNTIMYMRSR